MLTFPCPTCGQAMEIKAGVHPNGTSYIWAACSQCVVKPRSFSCWNCTTKQLAYEAHQSATPGMGNYCVKCEKDLSEWYELLQGKKLYA